MGTMTRPLEEVIELMASAAKKILIEENDRTSTESFGMSELVTTAGNITATFVDDGLMVRSYTEDSGTTVEIAVYFFNAAYAVSLDNTDEPEVEVNPEEVGMEYLGTLPAGGEETPLPVSETSIVNAPEEGCGCGCQHVY